ncbi:reverse transcriptase domain-containing protein [Tanacetum coccineum]
MQMIRDNQFSGQIQSDPHRHVADFLEISSLFQYGEDQEDAVMLRTFPFSLSRKAKTWLNELNEGTITSWNELREAFICRYFSPAKFRRLLHDIHNFYQLDNESLVKACLRIKEMLHTCYGHGKFKALAMKIDSEFLKIRKDLKEMRDGRRDNHALQIYMKDDTSMCEPHETNYVVELERQINKGLRNRQAIIQNLERQFESLNEKDQHFDSLPRTKNTKPRHEIVYKPPSIRNENNKGDVAAIEEDAIKHIPTMPNPSLIKSNSPTVSPFLKDSTVHIPYMNAKTFADDVLSNHVGDKEFKSIDGIGTGRMTKNENNEMGLPNEPNKEWKLNDKVVSHNKEVYHYLWHPIEISHLNRIIKES